MSDNVIQLVVNNNEEVPVNVNAVPEVINTLNDFLEEALAGKIKAITIIANMDESMKIAVNISSEDTDYRISQIAGLAIAQQRLIG